MTRTAEDFGWNEKLAEAAMQEGWGIFNGCDIQRIDMQDDEAFPQLSSDDVALRIVELGTKPHHLVARLVRDYAGTPARQEEESGAYEVEIVVRMNMRTLVTVSADSEAHARKLAAQTTEHDLASTSFWITGTGFNRAFTANELEMAFGGIEEVVGVWR